MNQAGYDLIDALADAVHKYKLNPAQTREAVKFLVDRSEQCISFLEQLSPSLGKATAVFMDETAVYVDTENNPCLDIHPIKALYWAADKDGKLLKDSRGNPIPWRFKNPPITMEPSKTIKGVFISNNPEKSVD